MPLCLVEPQAILEAWLKSVAPLFAGPALRSIAASTRRFSLLYSTGIVLDEGIALLNSAAWHDHEAGFEFMPRASLGGVASTLAVTARADDGGPIYHMLIQKS